MSKSKKSTSQKSKEEIKKEIQDLVRRSEESSYDQSDFFNLDSSEEDVSIEFDSSLINDSANPDKSYYLYYGIRGLLMNYLPQGHSNKKLRQFIYDEKNLFLNRGNKVGDSGIRGSDGRMAYIPNFLEVAFDTVTSWIKSGANPFDIWQAFYDLNEERGYHDTSEGLSDFNKKLIKALNEDPKGKQDD